MNNKQYRDALAKLDLTQEQAGELFRVGPRTSRRWALKEARIPAAVAFVLRLVLKKKIKLDDVWKLSAQEE